MFCGIDVILFADTFGTFFTNPFSASISGFSMTLRHTVNVINTANIKASFIASRVSDKEEADAGT